MSKKKQKKVKIEATTDEKEKEVVEQTPEEVIADLKDKQLRLFAELKKKKKRTSKERLELYSTANEVVLLSLLPVIDDFERATKAVKEEEEADLEGFNLIHQKLISTLEKYKVKKMEIKTGDEFDSEFHEAITSTPSDKKYKGKIVDVVENGYHIGENILRFAKVVTGS